MSEKIEPALSAEEWAEIRKTPAMHALIDTWIARGEDAKIIAYHNATLPDSDSRKITREKIAMLRRVAETQAWSAEGDDNWDALDSDDKRDLLTFADALESYLPPETT